MHRNKKNIIIGSTSIILATLLGIAMGFGIWGSARISTIKNGGIRKVTFFSNKGQYLDKGFNEDTYKGAAEFGKKTNQSIGIQLPENYFADGSEYINNVKDILNGKGETIISSGFNVAGIFGKLDWNNGGDFVEGPNSLSSSFNTGVYKNKSFYLLDDNDLIVAGGNQNSGSVIYKANESGFLSGLAAALHSTANYKEQNKKNLVTTWGGIEPATIHFLSGYEQGINYFNYEILGYKPVEEDGEGSNDTATLAGKYDKVKLSWNGSDIVDYDLDGDSMIDNDIQNSQAGDPTTIKPLEGWYTGGFDFPSGFGADEAKAKANAMKKTATVIFPVAGAQTLAALSATEGTETQVIGVDSDAGISSPDRVKNILGSSTKNLSLSAEYSLWYETIFKPEAISYKQETNPNWGNQKDFSILDWEDVNKIMDSNKDGDPYYDSIGVRNFATKWEEGNKGWNKTHLLKDKINSTHENNGQVFEGNFKNGGVGFSETSNKGDSKTKVNNDLRKLEIQNAGISIKKTFSQLSNEAFLAQDFIEMASATFATEGKNVISLNEWMLQNWERPKPPKPEPKK
ncbi:MAG: BMP family ABC transporter substrate-binding protein [Mycoplasmataceae bacterium]|nr:BMP family ABC transporter substrate-binding protein [Mycoplasmataceae bacterium]